jgi:molecular chaperone DnaJ
MTKQEALKVLKLNNNATDLDIKRAYRKLAKEYHPDVVGDHSNTMFLKVKEAYEALTSGLFSRPSMEVTHSSIFNVTKI